MNGMTTRRTTLEFRLQPSHQEIVSFSRTVAARADEKEHRAFSAGDAIASGALETHHLVKIAEWKAARSKSRVASNKEEDVKDALTLCLAAHSDRATIAVLTGLRGVNVPMASAILTAINRTRFTVIDVYALAALGVLKRAPTVQDYCDYVTFCRAAAREADMSLRAFDQGLWGWGENRLSKRRKTGQDGSGADGPAR